ncbi:MAG: molecular chaperone HtpG [Chlamydiales bacterium]|nr:molecular chaperone HtpG [Chlamydiales bacterium]
MTTMGTLKIHSENILPIIKKWLYSDKDIFVRELVSNACDAIRKVKILTDQGVASSQESEFEVRVSIDKEARTLTFADTGIGMDAEEVEKYIAQIAFSGAEEFLSKYSSSDEKDQIIGHFGLGFYSAYMVADKVEINTLSYKEGAEAVYWVCEGSSDYEIGGSSRAKRGTEIILHINKDSDEFLEEEKISEILVRYCSFLPYPIYLGDKHINNKEPLWTKPALDCTEKEYLEFYKKLYPFEEEPLFWVHLNVDYPFNLKGILYFPKIRQGFDFKKNQIKLFCNRVFVSDNCQDLIPDYLMILRGAIDSPDIPLNVSRSYLQMDRTVRSLASHISKKVAERLLTLFKTDKDAFYKAWPNIEVIIKLGALHDDKFYERIKELLVWKNNHGEWTTLEEYVERNKEKSEGEIFYTPGEHHASSFLELYKQQGIEVLFTDSMIDTALMSFLEGKNTSLKFQRIDGALSKALLDPSKEKIILGADGRSESAHLAQFVKDKLGLSQIEVEAKSLASDMLPAFIMIDESSRRFRDYIMMQQPEMPEGMMPPLKQTFVVNTNSKLMEAIKKLDVKDSDLATELVLQVYELACLSQKEIDPKNLSAFISRSSKVLEKLALRANK